MAADKEKACAGYQHGPPWVFKGSALYQLHLVKASTARAFVPRDLRLVEAFGYTLGGMFLARYHDSPAGEFDEQDFRFDHRPCSSLFLAIAAGGDRRHCVEPADLLRVSHLARLGFAPSSSSLHLHLRCMHCIFCWHSLIASRLLRHFLLLDWPQQLQKNRATCNKQHPYPPHDCTSLHGLWFAFLLLFEGFGGLGTGKKGGRVRCTCSAWPTCSVQLTNLLKVQLQPPAVSSILRGMEWRGQKNMSIWWAARVLVNSVEACRHGRKEVGLPSHVATFSKTEAASLRDKPLVKPNSFLNMLGIGSTTSKQGNGREIEISETKGLSSRHLCNISMPLTGSHKNHKWMGPAIRMSLPSFSGQTEDHPDLLKYSCQVECRVRPVKPARIWSPRATEPQEKSDGKINISGSNVITDLDAQSQSISVLLSRPIFALEFSSLRMHVDAPKIVVPHCKKKKVGYSST